MAAVHGCEGKDWRRRRIASSASQQTRFIRKKTLPRNALIVCLDRGPVLVQPTPFLLCAHDRAQPPFEGFGNVDAQTTRRVKQIGINEKIHRTLLDLLPLAQHCDPLLFGSKARPASEQAVAVNEGIDRSNRLQSYA